MPFAHASAVPRAPHLPSSLFPGGSRAAQCSAGGSLPAVSRAARPPIVLSVAVSAAVREAGISQERSARLHVVRANVGLLCAASWNENSNVCEA